MFGKRKENHEVRQDVVTEKENLSKDDIFKKLVEEYASSRMDLIIRLRQKRITDAEFMAYVDESLKKIDADTEARDQARLMFYQYVFRYFRLTSLIEDPEISDIHCMTDAGYGNAVYLQITCKLPIEQLNMDGNDMLRFFFEDGTIPIRVRRMSTAKN